MDDIDKNGDGKVDIDEYIGRLSIDLTVPFLSDPWNRNVLCAF